MALMDPCNFGSENIAPSHNSELPIESVHSLRSIKSLREIPLVETSVDFDSFFSDKQPSRPGSNVSTSKYSILTSHTNSNNHFHGPNILNALSPSFDQTSAVLPEDSVLHSIPSGENILPNIDSLRHIKDGLMSTAEVTSTPNRSRTQLKSSPQQCGPKVSINSITKLSGEIASMASYIGTWAPIAHHFVITASALQRDSAAFSSSLFSLLNQPVVELSTFITRFYQLRSAYSSLLSTGDSTTVNSNFQNYNRTNNRPDILNEEDNDIGTTWEDRQMVDSFMTLLRTSSGFLATALARMPLSDVKAFVSDEDGSPINILFYGVLGSARRNRARILAEILSNPVLDLEKRILLLEAVLKRSLNLNIGEFSSSTILKLERYLKRVLKGYDVEFNAVFYACLPDEVTLFVGELLNAHTLEGEQEIRSYMYGRVLKALERYATSLILVPHLYNALLDTYIGEKQKSILQQTIVPSLSSVVDQVMQEICERHKHSSTFVSPDLWISDELVVVKGSDIIQMYKSLLPTGGLNNSPASYSENDEEEWCLESIRADLVPVMLGLSHSISKTDGWQVFKIGSDGLMSDLATDLSLPSGTHGNVTINPQVQALCDAVSRFDGKSIEERVEYALQDAILRGDHTTVFLLQSTSKELTSMHLEELNRQALVYNGQCRALQEVVNAAVRDQKREKEKLSSLLDILDYARIHVWYDHEVRPCALYGKSREFLNQLYPYTRGADDRFPDIPNEEVVQTVRSKRMSILSSHMALETPFYNKDILPLPKLTDKEVDQIITYMRRHKTRNIIKSEEKYQRGLIEIANLAKKLVDRDHLSNYYSFKRDKQYQTSYSDSTNSANQSGTSRNSMHARHRSSLGLFDLFDMSYHYQTSPPLPVTLHATTSSQFLGLSKSQNSLRRSTSVGTDGRKEGMHATSLVPRAPVLMHIQQLLLSDIGKQMIEKGTETDLYMSQVGRMLLDGDSKSYQPLLEDLSLAGSPDGKLVAVKNLVDYTKCVLQCSRSDKVSRMDIVHELSKVVGRDPGTLYGDLQIISTLVSQNILDKTNEFEDVYQASKSVLETVVLRSMDYASRIMRYILETTPKTAPKTASAGITDTVAIYAFCAKQGNANAQQALADLYIQFPFLKLELMPLTRPSTVFQGGNSSYREIVANYWSNIAASSM